MHFQSGVEFYRQFVSSNDLCFDIGANVGAKTEMLLALGARVVSVEPQPALAREIAARAAYYGHKCTVIESAVGNREGMAKLHLKTSHSLATMLDDWVGNPAGEIPVSVTTLDRLIERTEIPKFIKIDVEGYELQVLQGLSHRVPFLTLEYHCDNRGVAIIRDCIRWLARFGSLEINGTGGEFHSLIFADWLNHERFLARFPECVAPHVFGDLIVRAG